MSELRQTAVLLVVLMLAAGACSTLRGEPEYRNWATATGGQVGEVDDRGGAGAVPIDPATPAPATFAFRATTLDGTELSGADLFEARPLVVSFVVPTCPYCVVEAPELAAAADRHPDVTFVVVHSSGSAADYRSFVESAGLDRADITHLRDDGAELWSRFGVVAQPSSVLVDGDGRLRRVTGALGEDGLDRAAELLRSGV